MRYLLLISCALLLPGALVASAAAQSDQLPRYYYHLSDQRGYLLQAKIDVPGSEPRAMSWISQVRSIKCAGRRMQVNIGRARLVVNEDGSFNHQARTRATSSFVRFRGSKRRIRLTGFARSTFSGVVGEDVVGSYRARLVVSGKIELASRPIAGSDRRRRVFHLIKCRINKPIESYRLETPEEFRG